MGKTQQLGMYPNIGISSSGTPTTNYLPKFTGASTIGDSAISDNGTTLSFGRAATFSSTITASGNLNLQAGATRNINFYDSGNTNINAQIQYDQITSNSGQLFFGTNNAGTFATRMTISNTGNVGIGTSSPSGLLDVANRGITKGSMPSGTILQVLQFKSPSGFSTSSSSDQDTGLKLSITPTSSTSKILIIVTINARATAGGGNCYVNAKLVRGNFDTGTTLVNGFAMVGNFSSTDFRASASMTFLDSPATTSSTQYVISMNSNLASVVYMDSSTTPSTITLMEIAQ